jgi:NTP pyrophosphatase (non-canonical NTP hydrolase)
VNQKGKVMTLQKEVFSWAEEQFGVNSELKIAIRGNKEMAELVSTISNGMGKKSVGEECADVAFFLIQICEKNGFDLMEEVSKKLVINRKREWGFASDGSYQHIEGT